MQNEGADLNHIGELNLTLAADSFAVDVNAIGRTTVINRDAAVDARELRVMIGDLQAVEPEVVVRGAPNGNLSAIVERESRQQLRLRRSGRRRRWQRAGS